MTLRRKNMNKKVVALTLALMMTSTSVVTFADQPSFSYQNEIDQLQVSDLLTDPKYKDLDIDYETLQVFLQLEQMQNSNNMFLYSARSSSTSSDDIEKLYNDLGDAWGSMTDSEKQLCILHPANAALAYYCVKEANKLTEEEYRYSRVGDESDAFRHTVWNALMQKYIGGSFPRKYATAHEDFPSSVLKSKSKNSNGDYDGYTLQDHTDMDLHNNAEGRSLVHWTEYFTISHEEIVDRVHNAIDDGDCYYLYDY